MTIFKVAVGHKYTLFLVKNFIYRCCGFRFILTSFLTRNILAHWLVKGLINLTIWGIHVLSDSLGVSQINILASNLYWHQQKPTCIYRIPITTACMIRILAMQLVKGWNRLTKSPYYNHHTQLTVAWNHTCCKSAFTPCYMNNFKINQSSRVPLWSDSAWRQRH